MPGAKPTRIVISATALLAGLALLGFAAVTIALELRAPAQRLQVWGRAAAAALIGAVVLVTAGATGCARCRRRLESTRVTVRGPAAGGLRAAMVSHDVRALLSALDGGLAQGDGPEAVDVKWCSRCRQVVTVRSRAGTRALFQGDEAGQVIGALPPSG